MQTLSLVLRFLLEHPPTPYLVPMPWHLPILLFALGLLAAGGFHHLIGHTFRFYKVGPDTSRALALPGLACLLISVQVLLGCYLLAATAPEMAAFALRAREARAAASPIGALLLSPAYARQTPSAPAAAGTRKESLRRALLEYSEDELLDGFRGQLETVRAKLQAPEGESTAGAPAPELLVLALRWAAQEHVNWPPLPPSSQAALQDDADGRQQRLPRYILSLVEEINGDSSLQREDWEHVAGSRFIQRVLEPLMVWHLRYLAVLLTLLVLVADLGVFFLIFQLKRQWLNRRERARRIQAAATT